VYGKLALRKHWAIQHNNLKDNYKQVKKWIEDGQNKGVLPQGTFCLEDVGVREALNKIIDDKVNSLQELKFKDRSESFKWSKDNIYKKIKKHLKYKRQKERRLQRRMIDEALQASHDGEFNGATHDSQRDPLYFLRTPLAKDGTQGSEGEHGVEGSRGESDVDSLLG